MTERPLTLWENCLISILLAVPTTLLTLYILGKL